MPFIAAKVAKDKALGESVTKAELAKALGVAGSALGRTIPEVRNGYCYM